MSTVRTLATRLASSWSRLEEELTELGPLGLGARLTLIYLVAHPPTQWWLQLPLALLAMAALLWTRLQNGSWLWLLVTYFTLLRVVLGYWRVDNHQFLFAYWCLALLIATRMRPGSGRDRVLATNARWLIGGAFLFALLWKAFLSPDFVRGDFFRAVLIKDQRFKEVSLLVGQSPETYRENQRAIASLRGGLDDHVGVREPPPQRRAAVAMTWWTLASEALVVLCFLAPVSSVLSRWRHATLLVFSWTTYAVATVQGFGWLLMILGVAQCEQDRPRVRMAYVLTFGLILIYQLMPWTRWIVRAAT